jgi:hypothetical protein
MANYYNRIVTLNVSETLAPTPSRLQGTAAIVSMGGTTLSSGATQYIASSGELANYLKPAFSITSLAWATGIVTLVTTLPHGIPVGTTTTIIVSGTTVGGSALNGYNGTFTATAADTTTLNYSVTNNPNPSSATLVPGTVLLGPQIYLSAADATWWAQGNTQVGYYIFESASALPQTVATAVETYLTANPQTIYNWGFLPGMDSDPTHVEPLFLQNNALTALIKFYLPVSASTFASWSSYSTLRNTFIMIQSPGAYAPTELDVISFMQYMTAFNPTPTHKLPPSQYTYLNGVTAYSPLNNTLINEFLAGNTNFVSTGAEGGISNTILVPGKNMDGTPANVGFSIDWTQINLNLSISNAVINGSNNPEAPLYYNQEGINTLQNVAGTVANLAISSGLALGQLLLTSLDPNTFATNVSLGKYAGYFVINAVPFATYVAENPSDYAQGLYGGFSAAYTPQYGFTQIVFNLNVTQFA